MHKEDYSCITFGYFDSFHLGHSHIIDTVIELGKIHNLVPTVITFFDDNSFVHTTEEEKKWLLKNKPINHYSKNVQQIVDFEQFLLETNAEIIVVGETVSFQQINLPELPRTLVIKAARYSRG